jgi:hypothetical protein
MVFLVLFNWEIAWSGEHGWDSLAHDTRKSSHDDHILFVLLFLLQPRTTRFHQTSDLFSFLWYKILKTETSSRSFLSFCFFETVKTESLKADDTNILINHDY